MSLDRRKFIKSSLALASLPSVLVVSGCGDNIVAILNTVIDSAVAVIAVAEPNAIWLSVLKETVATLKVAEQKWQTGSPVQIVISALETLKDITAVIPLTATYSPLVDILVAGIESVILALTSQISGGAAIARVQAKPNAHVNHVTLNKPVFMQSHVSAYKAQWNTVVSSNPALAKARLK